VHLEYILTEMLKNAFRATVENHYKLHGSASSSPLPRVQITISPPNPSLPFLSIRIRDQGGGVSPSNMARIFSYAFTTAGHDDDDWNGDGGPYAAQHIGGSAAIGSGDDGGLFGEITGKGLQVGLGTIAGLGYGLPMSQLYAKCVHPSLFLAFCPHLDCVDISVVHWIYFHWMDGVSLMNPALRLTC
jgi:26S proteasome regulatory subunit T1